MADKNFRTHATRWPETDSTMPAVFVGHGSPMNAIGDSEFSGAWSRVGRLLPRPRAILCISAHWETDSTRVTAMARPRPSHDLFGFPSRRPFDMQYPAPGNPGLDQSIRATLRPMVSFDHDWGLDHGAWSVLCRMFPEADIPVVQLSLARTQPPAFHDHRGHSLRVLRSQEVLILGSGNVVHNLGAIGSDGVAHAWAAGFDARVVSPTVITRCRCWSMNRRIWRRSG